MWLIRVDSFIEPGRRGCDLCFGRLDGVAVDAVDGVGDDTDAWIKPPGPGPGPSGRGDPIVILCSWEDSWMWDGLDDRGVVYPGAAMDGSF